MKRRRISTRKNYIVESAVVGALFVVADDIARRTGSGIARAAVLAWTAVGIAVGLCLLAASAVWQYAHPRDRAALTSIPRSGVLVALRTLHGVCAAMHGVCAAMHRVPALTASAVVALVAAWRWCDRQACAVIRRTHDVICEEHRRSQDREERAWLAMRGQFRPRLDAAPVEQPDYDEYEELWRDVGNPVGRAAA